MLVGASVIGLSPVDTFLRPNHSCHGGLGFESKENKSDMAIRTKTVPFLAKKPKNHYEDLNRLAET
jgi:hypothetical protein